MEHRDLQVDGLHQGLRRPELVSDWGPMEPRVFVPLMNLSRAYSVERRRLRVFQRRECHDLMTNVCMIIVKDTTLLFRPVTIYRS